jgi:hypothetical protein
VFSNAPDVPADLGALALAVDTDMAAQVARLVVLEAPGAAWTVYTPVWTATGGTPAVGSGGAIVGYYRADGKTIDVKIGWLAGSTGYSSSSGSWSFGLPAGLNARQPATIANPTLGGWTAVSNTSGVVRYVGQVFLASSTTVQNIVGAGPITVMQVNNPSNPWTTGDTVQMQFRYEAA